MLDKPDPPHGAAGADRLESAPCRANQHPLHRALFRVMRAAMFDEEPLPELDALPLAQFRLMWTVYFTPDATMKDFSEKLRVSQSTVTQLADRLVRRGLLERRHDAADRRVVRLRTSPEGDAVLSRADRRTQATFQQIWDRLSEPQRREVLHGLDIFGEVAEALRAEQGRPLPPWPEGEHAGRSHSDAASEHGGALPVVDLLARRVRGQSQG